MSHVCSFIFFGTLVLLFNGIAELSMTVSLHSLYAPGSMPLGNETFDAGEAPLLCVNKFCCRTITQLRWLHCFALLGPVLVLP